MTACFSFAVGTQLPQCFVVIYEVFLSIITDNLPAVLSLAEAYRALHL